MSIKSVFWSINEEAPISLPEEIIQAYKETLPYVRDFLTANHPFRKGLMCPFVPKAIKKGTLYFTYCHEASLEHINQTIDVCIEKLNESDSFNETAKAIIVLFDKKFSIVDLLKIHVENKIKCVSSSLMIGALYPASMAASLHSESFFPLRTPYPTLVLRSITPSDLIFLDPVHYSIEDRMMFLEAFVNKFSDSNIAKTREQVLVALDAINKYKDYKRSNEILA